MKAFLRSPLRITLVVIFSLIAIHVGLWAGHTYLPGFAGELCGKFQGLSATPFVMEFFLIAFGFVVVLLVNQIRQKREGDEFVELEIKNKLHSIEPLSSAQMISKKSPPQLSAAMEVTLATLEGSLVIKDFKQAKEILNSIPLSDRHHPIVKKAEQYLQSISP